MCNGTIPARSPSGGSAVRTTATVALTFAFYIAILLIAGFLLYFAYDECIPILVSWRDARDPTYPAHLDAKYLAYVTATGLICAFAVVYSSLPRRDRFVAAGPRIERAGEPRLFEEIDRAARDMGVETPSEVYLIPDLDVWAAWRGGRLGSGARRVLAIGLPCLGALTTSQFRALLARALAECDTGGAWAARAADSADWACRGMTAWQSSTHYAFKQYAGMLVRMTRGNPRRRMFDLDLAAARAAGGRLLAHGLRSLHEATQVFPRYLYRDVLPLVGAGFRPPLVEGLARCLQVAAVADVVEAGPSDAPKPVPIDFLPSLRERVAALTATALGQAPVDDSSPALTLLDHSMQMDAKLFFGMIARVSGKLDARPLKPVSWDEAGMRVFVPLWSSGAQSVASALGGVTPASLPDVAADPSRLLTMTKRKLLSKAALFKTLGEALALALVRRGWTPAVEPGRPLVMRKDDAAFDPFRVPPRLASGELTPAAWRAQCADLGIAELDLGAVAVE